MLQSNTNYTQLSSAQGAIRQNSTKEVNNQLTIFEYHNSGDFINNVRTIEIEGQLWIIAKDVCDVLGLQDVSKSLARLDEDEKLIRKLFVSGQNRDVSLINESGLYSLVLTSNKPEAKAFKKWITNEVIPSIRKTGEYKQKPHTPLFVQRFHENYDRVDQGYFSVIGELFIRVYGKLEALGHVIPDHSKEGKEIRMDVSVGKSFPEWLDTYYPHLSKQYKFYKHKLPTGFEVDARQYHNDVLPKFIEYIETDWLINRARGYFRGRDDKALEYLPKLLPAKKAS
ncbi:hypothetical protein MYP_4990 [Sporocytophaga myxococcoides]|uniref:Bro-N domain-containing protein n=1 Tax=Sporocytophaga myxococcoides TaxID=153721 RepID=A0A098LMP7_9BACT|nr:Bro-N domain-containing protein [Sporocytophaga myxococcoides]GAL87759.1 hypothetical protein MYP_4990 [Sporocytophaga myxococcoides]